MSKTTPALGAAALSSHSSHPTGCHMMTYPGAPQSSGSAMSLLGGNHLIMLLTHLVAAIAVGVWLLAGERVLWTLLALTAGPVVNAWRLVRNVACFRAGSVAGDSSRLLADWCPKSVLRGSMWTAGVVSRRGPPSAATPGTQGYAALVLI
jgi:hypothetical protein